MGFLCFFAGWRESGAADAAFAGTKVEDLFDWRGGVACDGRRAEVMRWGKGGGAAFRGIYGLYHPKMKAYLTGGITG